MQHGVAKARSALFQEINIPEIIKLQRFLKLSMGHLLPPEKLKEIKRQAKTTEIDLHSDYEHK